MNGTGFWRWSLSGTDELSAERGRRLWRRLVRWLGRAGPGRAAAGATRTLAHASGEEVRLFATLQDDAFRPVAGADSRGRAAGRVGAGSRSRGVRAGQSAGATWRASMIRRPGVTSDRARDRGGRELGRATSEFAVDRWSLEEARVEPDSALLARWPGVGWPGGTTVDAVVALGARARNARAGAGAHRVAAAVGVAVGVRVRRGVLWVEWAWRRRRGLP